MKRLITTGVLVLILAVFVGANSLAWAQGCGGKHEGKGFLSGLTDEQKEAVESKIQQLRDQGADREEIHHALAQMLEEYGIRMPDQPPGFGFGADLTDEQREAIRERTEEMKEQGATPEETRAAIDEMLQSYGVEPPQDRPEPDRPGHPWGDFGADLTDQQSQALKQELEEMQNRGASPLEMQVARDEILETYGIEPRGPMAKLTGEQRATVRQTMKLLLAKEVDEQEIRQQVAQMMEEYGVRMPSGRPDMEGFGPPAGHFGAGLTDEQKEAIREKSEEMKEQGATPQEIRSEVNQMLKSYGVQMPERGPGPHGPPGFGPRGGCFEAGLTDEQRDAIHEKIKQMRSEGATREKIRTQRDEMLAGYGIEWPGLLSQLSDEQRKAVREMEMEMRGDGAECEEILTAISRMLQEYGIDSPEESEGTLSQTEPAESEVIVAGSHPNPFNPETQICYSLGASRDVRIQIYNVSGQLIRTFDLGYQQAGKYSVKWDGRNQNGDMTASGVYLYRIEAGPYNVTNRMVLLK